ncbi:MAG TPA: hypothetical protein VHF47_10110 [Acidimicrobiales bacterium]|nr:hypothetical protein [Acidimicrobiales bacterium]
MSEVRNLPWAFPYVIETAPEDHPLGRTTLRPLVETRVIGPAGPSNKVGALIDSGSDYTLASPIVALEAGVDLRGGRRSSVRVGGAPRDILVLDVTVRLCDPQLADQDGGCDEDNSLEWSAEVGFFERWDDPPFSIILGQVGFFSEFTVILSRFSQVAVLERRDFLDAHYGELIDAWPESASRGW